MAIIKKYKGKTFKLQDGRIYIKQSGIWYGISIPYGALELEQKHGIDICRIF